MKLERGRLVMQRDVASNGRGGARHDRLVPHPSPAVAPRAGSSPWAHRMGVAPTTIEVRDLGYRWGSLGKNDRINFHWATIQLPPTLVDYVIVHELAHIHEPNHTPDFWVRVERALPKYPDAKSELARMGSGLWLGQADETPNE